jgi:predicted PurR-regulated permease PerM
MKNLTVCFITAFLLLTSMSIPVTATTTTPVTTIDPIKTAESAQAEVLISRLNAIKEMDKSSLTSGEKKQLRQETRAIKKNLKEIGQGVYLSVGAIVIIVLLLIVLL